MKHNANSESHVATGLRHDIMVVALSLSFIFVLSYAGHMVFNKQGHGATVDGHESTGGAMVAIYSTQEECERQSAAPCDAQRCDLLDGAREHEDICGEGFREIWVPRPKAAH